MIFCNVDDADIQLHVRVAGIVDPGSPLLKASSSKIQEILRMKSLLLTNGTRRISETLIDGRGK
jgi:hypothetical protein